MKASFAREIDALERALREMSDANLLGDAPVSLIAGPEEYLFGEEKALLEVIEGNDPMPRWLPPYVHGLFATTPQEGWSAGPGAIDADDAALVGSNPTLVTNVETLANVPLILTRGAEWYRTIGTRETPGPLICTVVGDVVHAGFAEIEPGTTVREVIDRIGGGVARRPAGEGGAVGRLESRARCRAARRARQLRRARGRGRRAGSAGFIVYDDTRSMVAVARMVSRFLYVESCGQCRACKFGCGEITRSLDRIAEAHGDARDIESIGGRLARASPTRTAASSARRNSESIASLLAHASRKTSPPSSKARRRSSALPVPKIVDIHDGVATYDEKQMRKQPDWTYASQ